MEEITAIIKRNLKQTDRQQQCASSEECRLMKLPQTRAELLKQYNPDVQRRVLGDVDRCYFGNAPTLAKINSVYGTNTAAQWLTVQLFDLSEFCGCKTKISESSLEQCAYIIAQMYYYLKMSEMMLFFQYFKSGKYGIFYGAVDAMKITTALREFCEERGNVIARHDSEEMLSRMREQRKNCISREDYDKIKKNK